MVFNHATWKVAEIPDLRDLDPKPYAILAVIPQFLVIAFNRLIERCSPRGAPSIIIDDEQEEELKSEPKVLEKVPSWTMGDTEFDKPLILPDE